jgi:deoxyribonuclease-4
VSDLLVGGHVSSSGGIFKAVERGLEIEAEAIQIFCSAPQMWRATKHTDEALEQFVSDFDASSIKSVWIHNIYLANLATDKPEMLEKSIASVVNALTIADKISATGVVLHTGSHKGLGIDAVSDQVITALTEILDQTPSDTKLALENMAGQGGVIGASFEELGMLIAGVDSDRLGVCFDTCHAFAAGYDISNSEGVDKTMKEFDGAIGFDKLLVVHANDSLMELGGNRDRHENIGQGFIGDEGFRALLRNPAFEGVPFLLEVPGYPTGDSEKGSGPDLENVNHLKKMRDG